MRILAFILITGIVISFGSCGEDEVLGCTDPTASNYNPDATENDDNCIFSGCTDSLAANYDPNATADSGNCIYPGCTDVQADQYDPTANEDDGSCETYFDRWTGTFAGDFDCDGELLAPYFGEAVMTFSKVGDPENKDSMEVYIEFTLSALPLNFGARVTRDSLFADTKLEGVVVDSIDLIPNVDEVYNITLQGALGINDANDNIDGVLKVLVEETASGLNVRYDESCIFDGAKQ